MSTVPAARKSKRDWALLLVLCGTIFLEGSDVSMLALVLLGAAVSAFGRRGARPADGRRKGAAPAARDEVCDGVPG
ncbi:hypothetical protein [Streptomyces azureus]|uniref:hypothetical protein n=1 Tax=Streptomyces azureus TaxID=146537 RepID=UPI00075153DA